MGQMGKFRTWEHEGKEGLIFFCPGCEMPHNISINGADTWRFNGDHDFPTITPSILVTGHDKSICHSYITDGNIQFLGDCTHDLKGQNVPLPDLPDWLKD